MNVILPYPISTNRYWRTFKGRTVLSAEARAYKSTAGLLYKGELFTGNVSVFIVLLPKLTKSGKASNTRIDLDNALKVAIDSLNGVAYKDDKQIVHIDARIGTACKNGGLSVQVFSSNN